MQSQQQNVEEETQHLRPNYSATFMHVPQGSLWVCQKYVSILKDLHAQLNLWFSGQHVEEMRAQSPMVEESETVTKNNGYIARFNEKFDSYVESVEERVSNSLVKSIDVLGHTEVSREGMQVGRLQTTNKQLFQLVANMQQIQRQKQNLEEYLQV